MQIDAKLIFESSDFEEISLQVQGTSMEPFLYNARDSVVLRKEENFGVGDIVVFRYHGNYVMHRVISLDGDVFTALGDNLGYPEKDVPVSDIVAKVTSVIRNGKRIDPSSLLWLFFSRIYIKMPIRRFFRKLSRLRQKITGERERKH